VAEGQEDGLLDDILRFRLALQSLLGEAIQGRQVRPYQIRKCVDPSPQDPIDQQLLSFF
jgi:hypothetical protein